MKRLISSIILLLAAFAMIAQPVTEPEKKERKKVERKPNPDKENLIAGIAEYLKGLDEVAVVNIANVGKIIEFTYNGKAMKIDLIEKRVPKN